jgi:hypothetical protein
MGQMAPRIFSRGRLGRRECTGSVVALEDVIVAPVIVPVLLAVGLEADGERDLLAFSQPVCIDREAELVREAVA